jgi:hypothetical protein
MLHQVGDLFEINVKLWCQKVNPLSVAKIYIFLSGAIKR